MDLGGGRFSGTGSGAGGGGGGGSVPTPPGPGVPLVSIGSTSGAYAWQLLIENTAGAVILVAGNAYAANTTTGMVNYTLPALASVPLNCQIPTLLNVSPTGAYAMTVSPDGLDNLMNPDTGEYAIASWTTAPSGNQQGRWVVWRATSAGWAAT
jgi:hypothetical protein